MVKKCMKNENGDAIVEATILFPIMIMIFMGLFILSMYMPTKAVLQYATKVSASAIATEYSDTWLEFDTDKMEFVTMGSKSELPNVYVDIFRAINKDKTEKIVNNIYDESVVIKAGELIVTSKVNDFIVYKEIVVTATKVIPTPLDLSFVGFPKELVVESSSTYVVQNGDELVRNLDIVRDVVIIVDKKTGISEMFSNVINFLGK